MCLPSCCLSVCRSVYLFLCLFISPFLYHPTIHRSVILFAIMHLHLPINLPSFVHSYVYLSGQPSSSFNIYIHGELVLTSPPSLQPQAFPTTKASIIPYIETALPPSSRQLEINVHSYHVPTLARLLEISRASSTIQLSHFTHSINGWRLCSSIIRLQLYFMARVASLRAIVGFYKWLHFCRGKCLYSITSAC